MTYYPLIIIMISLILLLSKPIIISTLNLCFLRLVELPIVIDYNGVGTRKGDNKNPVKVSGTQKYIYACDAI